MPSQLAPNVWILRTAPSAVTTTITLICLGETQFISVRKPIHMLHLPTACCATTLNFHLPPQYEGPPLEVNISLDMANLNMVNISSMNYHIWQHLMQHQNKSQLQHLASIPSVPVGQLYSHMAKGIQYIMPFHLKSNRRCRFNLGTVFAYRSLYNGYRIAYTSRFGNILLLFLLVLTCQISTLTFTTRYHAVYNSR